MKLYVDLIYKEISPKWDVELINKSTSTIGLPNYELPTPSFKVEWMETDESYATEQSVSIYLTVDSDYSTVYIEQLKSAGFSDYVSTDFGPELTFLADANKKAFLDVYFSEGYSQICIDIYKI